MAAIAERLQKIIAACGVASRRKAEALIAAGLVRVNGQTAALGDSADLFTDEIEVRGVRLTAPTSTKTLLLYKPRGYVTTLSDERGRKTVAELIPQQPRLYPVGRLDMYSEGLLLLTNDGALAHRVTHPSCEVEKVYHVWVSGYHADALSLLRRPIELDGRRIHPPKVEALSVEAGTAMLKITIHEGRNRQIRRMCQAAGLSVTRLKRVAEGELLLGDLRPGQWRELTPQELAYLNSL